MVRVKVYAIVFGYAFKDKANHVELCGTISQVIQTLRANLASSVIHLLKLCSRLSFFILFSPLVYRALHVMSFQIKL